MSSDLGRIRKCEEFNTADIFIAGEVLMLRSNFFSSEKDCPFRFIIPLIRELLRCGLIYKIRLTTFFKPVDLLKNVSFAFKLEILQQQKAVLYTRD